MRLSDVDKTVRSIEHAQRSRSCLNKPEDEGLEHALDIVLKVRDKLRIRKAKHGT